MRRALLPLLLACPLLLHGDDQIELPSNLSPGMRARMLAQNNTPQEKLPEVDANAPAEPEPAPEPPAEPRADPDNGVVPPANTGVVRPVVPPPVVVPPPAANPQQAQPGAVIPPPAANPQQAQPGAVIPPPAANPQQAQPGAAVPPRTTPNTGPGGFNRGGRGARGNAGAVPNARGGPAGGTPAGAFQADGAAPPPPEDPNDFLLAFTGNPIQEIVEEYQRISGHHVIQDLGLAGTAVVIQNPNVKMTREQGVDFIKASLLLQGFSIQEYKPGTDKIIMLTKPPLLEPPVKGAPIYMSADDLPDGDEVVNYIIRLDFLKAEEAVQVFAVAVPNHQWGKYVAVPSANTILVQDSVPNIRTLIRIKDQVDVEPVKQVQEFVNLERAAAEDVEALIQAILQAQTQAVTGGGGGGFRGLPGAPGGQPVIAGGPSQAATLGGMMPDGKSVIVKADPRTNRVFINGPKVHVEYLKKLIKQFDAPSLVKNIVTLPLRYIPVDDFLNIAANSLEARGAGAAGQAGAAGGTPGGGGGRNTGGQNQFGGGNRGGFGQNQFGGGGGGFGGGGASGRSGGIGGASSRGRTGGAGGGFSGGGTQSVQTPPRSEVVGKTLLISDPRMNTLLVTGPPESIERVSELVKEMDRRPLQVHINAVIAQITLGDKISTGVDLLRRVEDVKIAGQNVSIAGLYKTTGGNSFLDPANLDTIGGFTSSMDGLNLYATVGELFNAYVNALEATSQFKVLSKPHVATANNQTATITVGSRVPIPANQQSSIVAGGTTAVTSNVEYEDVDLILSVTPLINSKNEITIQLSQQNNTIAGSTVINGNAVPNIQTQTLENTITVPNGAIFTVGGSISETKDDAVTGLPFVSKIPIIKHLFGTSKHNTSRQELLIMVQPRIIDTADDMIDVHTSEVQRTIIGPEAENFTKPERNTSDLQLPTYEKNIPFESAGYPENAPTAPKGFFRRLGSAFKTR